MAGPGRFGAVVCAMATPFGPDGSLDLDGAARLARWLVDQGNDALVVSGTTGESPVLSDGEKRDLWQAVAEAVTVPVIAGTSTADTAHSVELTRAAADAGAAGILAVTPYYSRPHQAGIEAHMRAIGAASPLPVLLYDIPVRAGRKVAPEVIWRLAEDGVIVGVKDATANPAATAALIAGASESFELYSGNDGDTLPLLAVGAVGLISVESHWAAPDLVEMMTAWWKGDTDHARVVNARLIPSHQFQSSDDAPNPLPTKAMLTVLGQPAGPCRLPLGGVPDELLATANDVLSQLSQLRSARA